MLWIPFLFYKVINSITGSPTITLLRLHYGYKNVLNIFILKITLEIKNFFLKTKMFFLICINMTSQTYSPNVTGGECKAW